MIIQSYRHKGNSIKKLVNYMISGMRNPEEDLMIAHGLPSFNPREITKAFLIQDKYRQMGKGTVRWYHDVLSFRPSDTKHLNNNIISDLAQEYINRRCERGLAFCVAHMGEAHVHVHITYSSTQYRSRKNLFLNNKEYMGIRMDMERYQQKHYPQLKSIVYLSREKQRHRGAAAGIDREYQTKLRLGDKLTEKEQLTEKLEELYDSSQSVDGFIEAIENAGLSLYYRNGKATGIESKRRYRFRTLGITNDKVMALRQLEERRRDIERLTSCERDEREL